MKLLTVQIHILVLIEGSQSLQCKVCEERLVGGTVRYTSDILDNICSDTEADNMDTCQSEEDVCKIQLLLRHFFRDPLKTMTRRQQATDVLWGLILMVFV